MCGILSSYVSTVRGKHMLHILKIFHTRLQILHPCNRNIRFIESCTLQDLFPKTKSNFMTHDPPPATFFFQFNESKLN